jgi:hypothetical protein
VIVRVVGLVPEVGLTASQLPELVVLALKFVPLNPLRATVCTTGEPNAIPERFSELGLVTRPGVAPGASTVTGIVKVVLPALFAVITILPVLKPGPSLVESMPIPIEVGVVLEVTAYATKDGTEATENVRFCPDESWLALMETLVFTFVPIS